jgi:hypothetical protein
MSICSEPIVLAVIGGVLYQIFPIIENLNKKDKHLTNLIGIY